MSWRDRSLSSDRFRSRRDRLTSRDLRIATGLGGSVRDPLLVGEVAVIVRGHAIPLAALVTARGHGSGRFFLLIVRGQGREADEPDGRVGRL